MPTRSSPWLCWRKSRLTVLLLSAIVSGACGSRLSAGKLEAALGPVPGPAQAAAGHGAVSSGTAVPVERLASRAASLGVSTGAPDVGVAPGTSAVGVLGTPAGANRSAKAAAGTATAAFPTSGAGGRADSSTAAPSTASGGPAAPARPGPVPVPVPSGGPKAEIRLATLGVGSGPLGAVMRPIPDAARAWAAWVNEHGGLNGHPVRLLVGDDGAEPSRSLALARQFVEQEKVQAFFGTHMVTTEEAVTPYLEQKRVPIIGTCNCSAGNDVSPMVFFFGPSASKGLGWSHLAAFAALTQVKKVGFVYCREAQQCKGAADEARPLAEQAGLQVVYTAQVSLAQPDYTAEAISARNAGAEAVAVFADNQTAVRFIRSADRQGWKPAVSTQQSGYDERMLSIKETEGMYTSAIVPDFSTDPRLGNYRKAMDKLPGGIRATIGAGTFVVGQLLEKLAPGFPDNPTPEDFIRAMEGLRGETMGGLLPPISFHSGVGHEATNRCVIPTVIHNGKFETPTGDRFVCAPGWKPVQL